MEVTIVINKPEVLDTGNGYVAYYAVGDGVDSAAAVTAAQTAAEDIFKNLGVFDTDYATTVAKLLALTPPWTIDDTDTVGVPESGNLYGSSKDVGTISGKMPALNETGGRVNRVGFKRIELEGSIEKFGFFQDYTQDSLDFDTDSELLQHINREMIMGANEITEDALQIDLLHSAGVIIYGGSAMSTGEISGEAGEVSTVNYEDLMKLSIILDENRCPKSTKIISGSRMVDTRTINATRLLYIGNELIPMVKRMTDLFGNPAFISVEQYAAAGDVAAGEIGKVDQYTIIVVPEMMNWSGAGKAVATNTGYRETGGKYNVYPMLVVGDGSFSTIGFQTDGKTTKFKIKHSKPGDNISFSAEDPYGTLGFMSIQWWYGIIILRAERLAVIKCVAEY